MEVKLLNSIAYHSLLKDRIYRVIGLDDKFYRLLDDNGEPCLYEKEWFELIDDKIPESWVWDHHEHGEYYADPKPLAGPGFYEDYFDRVPEARAIFQNYIKNLEE